jgi:hypothetical protein
VDPQAPVPFSGTTDPGVPFQLPQQTKFYNGRRSAIGSSNSLTISWDGRLVMYQDSGFDLWDDESSFTRAYGYVFATFDKEEIELVDGRPNFEEAFGDPFPRFAALADDTPPNGGGNTYPAYPGYTGGPYPLITGPSNNDTEIGSMGELGLLVPDYLSNNLYPAPVPAKENPFPSDADGNFIQSGQYETYWTAPHGKGTTGVRSRRTKQEFIPTARDAMRLTTISSRSGTASPSSPSPSIPMPARRAGSCASRS